MLEVEYFTAFIDTWIHEKLWKNKESSWLKYWEPNNLYGWPMLPVNDL